ncbi:hypothetical protein AB205_0128170 [Aquarana catesbeiana]|uniref:Uncharacterized protein n=1 Tax=Aquarana catesbeiana TaxID=8400 RepID=A0A2G9RRM8_AQUCT|nr:hypothetical protein AB205_0128170 [Aquarana catesbeiana]
MHVMIFVFYSHWSCLNLGVGSLVAFLKKISLFVSRIQLDTFFLLRVEKLNTGLDVFILSSVYLIGFWRHKNLFSLNAAKLTCVNGTIAKSINAFRGVLEMSSQCRFDSASVNEALMRNI